MFNIEGNSNYKVYIDDGYVIKKSINKSDSKRLEIQCKKQKDFQNKIFKSPQIYNQDTNRCRLFEGTYLGSFQHHN